MRAIAILLFVMHLGIGCSSSDSTSAPPGAALYGSCATGGDCASQLCLGVASGYVCTKECATNSECVSANFGGQTIGACVAINGKGYCSPVCRNADGTDCAAGPDAGANDAGSDATATGGAGGTGGSGGSGGGTGGTGGAPCIPTFSGGECDIFPQCGCELGEKCVLASEGSGYTTGCFPAGSAPPLASCQGGCGAGYECILGACAQYCNASSDCPEYQNGARCIQMTFYGDPVPGVYFCTSACDPTIPSTCGTGAGCVISRDNGVFISVCQKAGYGTGDNSCASDSFACAKGFACVSGDCRKYCRIGQNDCPSGQSCSGLNIQGQPIVYKGYTWGACW